MLYTYKVLVSDTLPNDENLNKLGIEGWELVTIIAEHERYYSYFLKGLLQ